MKEAIPQEEDYLQALNDIQRANTIVVNAYSENNPDKQIPNPIREVQNIPLPGEVMASFQVTGPMTQTILGSFSSNRGQEVNGASGKAIIESLSADNAASEPFIVGYLAGLTQVGNIVVDLMPKYIVGKRTIPITGKDGEREYKDVNYGNNPYINYDERAIKVNIDAGVNFQVQKTQALQQITGLMQASPEFAQFMNSPKGLGILLDNIQCYGADRLKEAAEEWLEQQAQQQQQAMQMQQQAMMQNPQMIKAQADAQKVQIQAMQMQLDQQQNQVENQLAIAKQATDNALLPYIHSGIGRKCAPSSVLRRAIRICVP